MLPPGIYRHHKGNLYYLLTVGRHTETDELMCVYCTKDNTATWWIRPLSMWQEVIEWPDGIQRARFVWDAPLYREAKKT